METLSSASISPRLSSSPRLKTPRTAFGHDASLFLLSLQVLYFQSYDAVWLRQSTRTETFSYLTRRRDHIFFGPVASCLSRAVLANDIAFLWETTAARAKKEQVFPPSPSREDVLRQFLQALARGAVVPAVQRLHLSPACEKPSPLILISVCLAFAPRLSWQTDRFHKEGKVETARRMSCVFLPAHQEVTASDHRGQWLQS